MVIEWLSHRGYRRCTVERTLDEAKQQFRGVAFYIEFSDDNGRFLDATVPDGGLRIVHQTLLRRSRLCTSNA